MYSVFEEKLQTDMGKYYVRQHDADFDAQAIFESLSTYAKKSTQASIDTADLLSYITTIKLHDSTWRSGAHAFVLHWCDKLRVYEDLVPQSDHFTDNVKLIMLQNTVTGVSELNQVKVQSAHDIAHGKSSLTFTSYKDLLLSAATVYDTKRGIKMGRQQRYINTTEQFSDSSSDFDLSIPYPYSINIHDNTTHQDEIVHDIDTDFSLLQINRNEQHQRKFPFRPSMSKEKWDNLSKTEKELWDKFSPNSKAIILGITKPSPAPSQPKLNLHNITAADYIHLINKSQQFQSNDTTNHDADNKSTSDNKDTTDSNAYVNDRTQPTILTFASKQLALPGDLLCVLSSASDKTKSDRTTSSPQKQSEIVLNGVKYRSVHIHERVQYHISAINTSTTASLVDRGANGGLAGSDVRIISKNEPTRTVDVSGIENHQVKDLPIVTVGGVVPSQRGPVIVIMHQYAYLGEGHTIHSCGQLEWYKNDVNDKSVKVHGGLQRIQTLEGYVHPLDIRNGLPYVSIRPYTDDKWESLPRVIWTSDADWDPTVLDHLISNDNKWYDAVSDLQEQMYHSPFDEFGNYKHREVSLHLMDAGEEFHGIDDVVDYILMNHNYTSSEHPTQCNATSVQQKSVNYDALKPFFLNATSYVIKKTFEATTQYARTAMTGMQLKNTFKSPFPALNVHRRNEPVATDSIYADVPAIDNGATIAQIFVGRKSLVTDIYAMKSEKEFVNTLQDNIRKRGAMDKLISDSAQVEVSNRVLDILRAYCVDDWQSEPHYQHQNFAERRYATIKPLVNILLNTTGAPPELWLLALLHVCYVLNHTAIESLGWRTPLETLLGSTPDISAMLLFSFYEKIYYKCNKPSFPSDSTERVGRFVGIADHVGHALTFKVLTEDTDKIIFRSKIRSASTPHGRNLRLDPIDSTSVPKVIKSKHDGELEKGKSMPTLDPDDLIGRTFLKPPENDGRRYRAKIVEAIEEKEKNIANHPDKIKFRCSVNNDEYEEIVSYNDIINHIEKDDTESGEWKFTSIDGHQGPLSRGDKDYKGCRYNVLVNWDSGESTYEPLNVIAHDDPVSCALYAKDNNLLEEDGWKRFKKIAKRQKKLKRLLNQAKLHSYCHRKVHKFGVLVPRNHQHAMELDRENGNTKWLDAENLELKQIHYYDTFINKGKMSQPLTGYKKIKVHFVYDVKHDGRHKARLVAGGHLTDEPIESIYSGVVSLKGIRLITFLAELNELDTWCTDIGNAYLEATTKEKIYIVAGPELGDLEGHTLIINKALYGLKSSGLRWHEKLADTLRDMGFKPSKAESDIWMRENVGIYEYIAPYVDDLCIAAKNPEEIIKILEKQHGYKLKGTGPIHYHLGCDYFRDKDGNLCYAPKKYIEKMLEAYLRMFGSKPKECTSPLEKGDHPELDTSEELDDEGVNRYQSLIGALQWTISLGRIDITTAVMTLSSFRANPRKGHMDRAKRIYGYLSNMRHSAIRIRTGEPDFSDLPEQEFDWAYSVYGNVKEVIPEDIPTPLGNQVTLTAYKDANLYHNLITGHSVTGILHLINGTPFDWYSKKQNTVETSTYGSEFVAARIAVDQIFDHRITLRYLGVPINKKTYLFGDNKTVVDSSTIPHARLHKRHTALSYHRVREAIASKIIAFHHIDGKLNPADLLSKHWGYQQIKVTLKPLLFYEGDTLDLVDEDGAVQTDGE